MNTDGNNSTHQQQQLPEQQQQQQQQQADISQLAAALPHGYTEKQLREVELREQDRWLPIANVARLMKNTLPTTAKVSKDAKECMQECVSEFISFITSESSDRCLSEKRKTINGEDILFAMASLGFENYSEVLKIYLAKYREQQALRQERGETKRPKKHNILSGNTAGAGDTDTDTATLTPTGSSHNTANPANNNNNIVFDPEQQLQREITNIPLQDSNSLDIEHQIINTGDILSLEEEHNHQLHRDSEQSIQHSDASQQQQTSSNSRHSTPQHNTPQHNTPQPVQQQQEHPAETLKQNTEQDNILYQYTETDQY